MSVCLEHNAVLANTVGTSSETAAVVSTNTSSSPSPSSTPAVIDEPPKNVTKLIVANPAALSTNNNAIAASALPKLVTQPLITVLNSPGPLTVVKSLCVTSGTASAPPQFTLVNSAPLTVTNATTGRPSTITLLNAPVALVKAVPAVAAGETAGGGGGGSEKPAAIHNVFVKNTCAATEEVAAGQPPPQQQQQQQQKVYAGGAFTAQTGVIPCGSASPPMKTINGQQPMNGSNNNNKVKILSNMVMSPTVAGPSNLFVNKTNMQRYLPRQKVIGNGATTKYINKPTLNNVMKSSSMKNAPPPQRSMYPTHKGQIKTLPPVNNYVQKGAPGIKTIPPQNKGVPGQVQRTNTGIRTIPPQRLKPPAKPNYIGKHAIQAQKVKSGCNRLKSLKPPPPSTYRLPQNSAVNFNQALTAEIIQTLSHESGPSSYTTSAYDLPVSHFSTSDYLEKPVLQVAPPPPQPPAEEKFHPSSGLNTLSLICHAVYLDHNYNATLPPDSPTGGTQAGSTSPQVNGGGIQTTAYSPGSCGKRLRQSATSTPSLLSGLSSSSLLPSGPPAVVHCMEDDDAASDVSCLSDRKGDTEGEETDTAPEAEAVNNDDQFDHYGDYVTRCICGFLHDDGYMIECDRCKVWQHVRCVVRNKQVPDEYLCEVCDPVKPVDRYKARLAQQQWLKETQIALDAKLRKETKIAGAQTKQQHNRESATESDSSDGEVGGKPRLNSNARRKSDNQKHNGNSRLRRDSTKDNPQKRPPKRKEKKVIKRKTKSQPKSQSGEEDNNHHDLWLNPQLPQLRQWIENYEEAVTNHYSPELRARISNIRINGAHSELSTQMEPGVQKCRVHVQPLTGVKYLVSTALLAPNTPVVELRGKYMLSTQHRNSGSGLTGSGLTTRQHAQRPGPFLFFYRLHSGNRDNTEVCVDTRTYGNSARFVRRSCRPNAELRHCIEKGVLHLYIVTIAEVERNGELTIRHESHDLAAVGTTNIACACGASSPEECLVNKTGGAVMKRNGEKVDVANTNHRKRRGRRTNSISGDQEVPQRSKETTPPPVESPPVDDGKEEDVAKTETEIVKEEVKTEEIETKEDDILKGEVKEDVKKEQEVKEEKEELKEEEKVKATEDVDKKIKKREIKETKQAVEEEEEASREAKTPTPPPPPPPSVSTRRSSHRSSEPEEKKETPLKDDKKNKKLSREERKLEAIMKAFERMEKQAQRRQEHQAKQAHRRESEPGPGKDEEKTESKGKRRKRKGRARTTSTNSQASQRNRLNSADSSYLTSGDEQMLSPNDNTSSRENLVTSKENSRDGETGSPNKAVGLLLSLANGENATRMENKTPPHDIDSNSNSAHSSPETPLSSACLLVAAAVGPMEPGFKFPKTKKGLMNEWLNKTDIQSASAISPSSLTPHLPVMSEYDANTGFYAPSKITQSYCEPPTQPRASAKKRWLRQAISEDQCDSPNSRPESPPISEAVAPPKKRRLPRESLSNNDSPPTTPTNPNNPTQIVEEVPLAKGGGDGGATHDGRVEIIYSGTEGDSPTQVLESDAILKERAAEMQQEFGACIRLPEPTPKPPEQHIVSPGFLLDPRLNRDLVGTVEKQLSIFGLEDRRPENITPAKRKLSITEYRQRKKMNNNEKAVLETETAMEESNLSQSPKLQARRRSNSSSSVTSFASSDDETRTSDVGDKGLSTTPAFNSEPTELERQRENVGLRLKKAFGLAVDDELRKPALNVQTLLKCDLPPVTKTVPLLPSPTFPIPGSSEPSLNREQPSPLSPAVNTLEEIEKEKKEGEVQEEKVLDRPVMFYTPDEEENAHANVQVDKEEGCKGEETESVERFDGATYPHGVFDSFNSVIDDDARYEGRNPSPPPELDAGAYQRT